MKRIATAFSIFSIVFATHSCLRAQTQFDNLGTANNSVEWRLSGGGASLAASFQTDVNRPGAIAITENALQTGEFAEGGILELFNGFWVAQNDFFLPEAAINILLEFEGFFANDRGRAFLNDIEFGNVDHLDQTGLGFFKHTEDGNDEPFTFSGTTSGVVTTGFLPGQINTLKILVNNTGQISILAPTMTFDGVNDATTAFIEAVISYDLLGDVNCDGIVDLLDVAPFVDALLSGIFDNKADINQDGSVDLLDIDQFVGLLIG